MLALAAGGAVCAAAGFATWAVRGRSSSVLGPSVWRGPAKRRAIALTFDDGPSESTHALLNVLASHNVPATFFVCGWNVGRLPDVLRDTAAAGHQIGNHSYSHPAFYFKSAGFILDELARTQLVVGDTVGHAPALFRAPYGVRWPGLSRAQQRLGLLGVMWTVIGCDWRLSAPAVAGRVLQGASAGAIICLHDGRDLSVNPDISETIGAVRTLIPELKARGYSFETVSQLLCPTQ